jgi:hypothetical protein
VNVAAASILALCASVAMAREFAQPTMKVGDRYTYRISGGPDKPTTFTETVVDVLPGGRYRIRLDGTSQPGMREFDGPGNLIQPPPWPSLKPMHYPVAVGKAWSHSVADTPAQTRSIAYRGVAIETVRVAGNALECLRIEGTETTTNSGIAVPSQARLWYCPAARAIARKETRIPRVGLVTQELTAYHLAAEERSP